MITRRTDWMPASRDRIITMAADWLAVLATKATAWGVPAQTVTDLTAAKTAAAAKLAEAESPQRNPIITAECKAAFDDMEAKMRDMKKRYFLKPPLEDADFVSLSLPVPDRIPTPHPVPSLKPDTDATPSGKGKHTVTAINPETEDKKKPDLVTGVAFASRVRNASDPRAQAEDMPSEYQTSTVKVFQYPEADYGKVADYATAYEAGGGKRGPWSDVVSEIIA
jgi:hypothetical protein